MQQRLAEWPGNAGQRPCTFITGPFTKRKQIRSNSNAYICLYICFSPSGCQILIQFERMFKADG